MIAARIVKHILNLRRKIAVIIALVAFLTVIVHAGEKVERTTEEFRSFLSSIEGSWKGQAVKTPVGPRPYDIRFRRTSNALVEGHANPGEEATHYWTFFSRRTNPYPAVFIYVCRQPPTAYIDRISCKHGRMEV